MIDSVQWYIQTKQLYTLHALSIIVLVQCGDLNVFDLIGRIVNILVTIRHVFWWFEPILLNSISCNNHLLLNLSGLTYWSTIWRINHHKGQKTQYSTKNNNKWMTICTACTSKLIHNIFIICQGSVTQIDMCSNSDDRVQTCYSTHMLRFNIGSKTWKRW